MSPELFSLNILHRLSLNINDCDPGYLTGFSLDRLHMGGFVPPYGGGTSAGGQSISGGTHEGDIDLMGGPNFDRLYHKLKVLLLLSCNYMMQFISYDSIKTR